jgi:hypothetical protein
VNGAGILVITGPPCAGKSSVGRLLAADTSREREVYLEVDTLFSLLLPRSDRSRQDRLLGYDAAHALARTLVLRNYTAILECTYARREQRASLLEAMSTVPCCAVGVVELVISPDEAVRRFRQRREATDLDEASVRERVENFPYWDTSLRLHASEAAPRVLANQLVRWWRRGPVSADWSQWVEAGRACT